MNLFRLVNHWLHLLSVIFWLGGLAYLFLLLVPTLRRTVSEQVAGSVLWRLHRTFTTVIFFLTFVLMVTGAINLGMSRHGGTFPPQYISILGAKLFLVVIFLTIAWKNYLDVRRQPDQQVLAEVPMLRLSFVLAIAIVFLAAALRTLYPH
ncbi:MAG: CopD family protein [Nitrospirae bacterium]|nr:CopD family protein [Nitrospirota bacterium]